ncbi:hypothetical protein KXV60_007245 [Aspergillus fumigatus]|nr:hypothetical protein KXV60_007245 [Aspergillus fumigatus]
MRPWALRRRLIALSIIARTHLSGGFTALMMNGRPILIDQPKKGVVIVEHAMRVYRWFGIWTRMAGSIGITAGSYGPIMKQEIYKLNLSTRQI